jgi:hypothetical protein
MTDTLYCVSRGNTYTYQDKPWTAVWGVESPDSDARVKIKAADGEIQVVPIVQLVKP